MIAAVIFSNTTWTFWDVMLLFFVWIPLLMLWFFCLFDVFGRSDLSGIEGALGPGDLHLPLARRAPLPDPPSTGAGAARSHLSPPRSVNLCMDSLEKLTARCDHIGQQRASWALSGHGLADRASTLAGLARALEELLVEELAPTTFAREAMLVRQQIDAAQMVTRARSRRA